MKQFEIPSARFETERGETLIAVVIPWSEYKRPLVRAIYAGMFGVAGATAVVLSIDENNEWAVDTVAEDKWQSICETTPLNTIRFQMMKVECEILPRDFLDS